MSITSKEIETINSMVKQIRNVDIEYLDKNCLDGLTVIDKSTLVQIFKKLDLVIDSLNKLQKKV